MARGKKDTAVSERAQRVAEMQRQAQAKERRRTAAIWGIAAALLVAIVAVVAFAVIREQANTPDLSAVVEYEELSNNHVETPVAYEQTPPVGGDHNGVWLNCDIYDQPVPNEHAVHSLEHGAVWITYDPNLPPDQVAELEEAARAPYMLLSPYEGLEDGQIFASAWGLQLELNGAQDPRLDEFVQQYKQGPQTPEPGASCTGGTSTDLVNR